MIYNDNIPAVIMNTYVVCYIQCALFCSGVFDVSVMKSVWMFRDMSYGAGISRDEYEKNVSLSMYPTDVM